MTVGFSRSCASEVWSWEAARARSGRFDHEVLNRGRAKVAGPGPGPALRARQQRAQLVGGLLPGAHLGPSLRVAGERPGRTQAPGSSCPLSEQGGENVGTN